MAYKVGFWFDSEEERKKKAMKFLGLEGEKGERMLDRLVSPEFAGLLEYREYPKNFKERTERTLYLHGIRSVCFQKTFYGLTKTGIWMTLRLADKKTMNLLVEKLKKRGKKVLTSEECRGD